MRSSSNARVNLSWILMLGTVWSHGHVRLILLLRHKTVGILARRSGGWRVGAECCFHMTAARW